MKVAEKTITVELTEHEIKTITNALHLFYKEQESIDYDNARDSRLLRNDFGDLIGVRYMGKDA